MKLRVQDDSISVERFALRVERCSCHPEGAASPRPKDHQRRRFELLPALPLCRSALRDPSRAMKLRVQDDSISVERFALRVERCS
jgi:hypothetical protein